MKLKKTYFFLLIGLLSILGSAQDAAFNANPENAWHGARDLAYEGKHTAAMDTLNRLLENYPDHTEARALLARTHSWEGEYEEARAEFNKITSYERYKKDIWVAAIKNELYANNSAIALGLANKAIYYIEQDEELERLRTLALKNLETQVYKPYAENKTSASELSSNHTKTKVSSNVKVKKEGSPKKPDEKQKPKNTIGVSNSFTVFSEVYDPSVSSGIDFKRQTRFGSIIPRISYSNRFQTHGLQYSVSMYPKIVKKVYAYLNYGFSSSPIFPNHRLGGDLYASLPGAIEASAGMRYMSFDSRDISILTNSLGLYKGNYYFSLRSYITPKSNNLTRVSGNLVARKYLKDGENYLGISGGIGFSPELKQIILDGTLLSETLLYLESQRLNFEYQFTGKNTPNIYKTRLGIARRELFGQPGNFLFSVSAGLTYKVKF